jgi:hypothetical protein
MPVTTTVITIAHLSTLVTYLLVPAHPGSTTFYDIVQGLYLPGRQGVLLHELPSKLADHFGQLRCITSSTCHIGSQTGCGQVSFQTEQYAGKS